MKARARLMGVARGIMAGACLAAVAPADALAAGASTLKLQRIATTAATGGAEGAAFIRTADGTLHLVYSTQLAWSGGFDGLGALSIAPAGTVLPAVQAVPGWHATDPGLFVTATGALTAVFGGSPDSGGTSYVGPWSVVSSDGGHTWSTVGDVGSHADEAFAGAVTAHLLGATPVITLAAAGGLTLQSGFGPGSPASPLTLPGAPIGAVESAQDASTGELVASWYTAVNHGGLWLQGVAPAVQPPQEIAGAFDSWGDQQRQVTLASLDNGPGVYAAYSPDGKRVRLIAYGAATSIPVGKLKSVPAVETDVATGPEGRVWVMWGTGQAPDSKFGRIAVTRSNKARTSFEPVQVFDIDPGTLWRLYGDGRLGPLDLLTNLTPNVTPAAPTGIFYARVRPVLTADLGAKQVKKGTYKVGVRVTDAGDPVPGADVTVNGSHAKTNMAGTAKVSVTGDAGDTVHVTVTAPTYRPLTTSTTL